ncbi:MAG: hypothetical protein ACYC8T_15255 [Myxococcaceae bacterium]
MTRGLALAAGALWLLSGGQAAAAEIPLGEEPIRLDVTSTTIGAWHGNNGGKSTCDDFYGVGLEKLNANASRGGFGAGLRLDGSLYLNRPQGSRAIPPPAPPSCLPVDVEHRYFNAVVPEKLWAGWKGRNLEVTVGDSYVSFGRGLALSLRKTDELGVDTTERGLRVKLSNDRFSGTVVGGFANMNNLDEASGRSAPDYPDLVLGAQADAAVVDKLRVGAHAAGFAFQAPKSSTAAPGVDESYRERWLNAGPTIDAPRLTKNFGFYLEGLVQRRWTVSGGAGSGYGLYGTATANAGPATLLFEGKAYGDLEVVQPKFDRPRADSPTSPLLRGDIDFLQVQYAVLPTAERVAQQLEHPQKNVAGGRLRFDWAFSEGLVAFANYGLFRDDGGYQSPDSGAVEMGVINDPYAGVDYNSGPLRIQVDAGWRWVTLRGVAGTVRSDGHLDASVMLGLGHSSMIDLHLIHWEREKAQYGVPADKWREGTLLLSYRFRPLFAVAAILDYSTDKTSPSDWYPGASVEWNINSSSSVRLFAGSSRGGLRCVSGLCKVYPPFTGAKTTVTARF